jgi:thiamine-phosphate pyrophosphorylase
MSAQLKFPAGLYGVTPEWGDAVRLEDAVRAAARGGMRALQLRHKTADAALRHKLGSHIREVCKELNIVFLINDDWRLAKEIDADGVHLGRDDGDPRRVREVIGPDMLIGVSCYADPERAESFLAADVAYVAFGAMFASQTKPFAPVAPLSVLQRGHEICLTQLLPRPAVVAIGGIDTSNAHQIFQAGADAIAVVGGLFLAENIEQTARTLSNTFSIH